MMTTLREGTIADVARQQRQADVIRGSQKLGHALSLAGTASKQTETVINSVRLTPLMDRSQGTPDIGIGLIDGPVALTHPDLEARYIRDITGKGACSNSACLACLHGTFVAGILCARRGAVAPALCPDCSLCVRPIFGEGTHATGQLPSASVEELAAAIHDCIEGGARVLNVSAALSPTTPRGERALLAALALAVRREVLVVAAAGNQGLLGSTTLTRHPWTIPVAAAGRWGSPSLCTNLGHSVGRHGVAAPGEHITSIGADGGSLTWSGSSASAPFVTGTIALLWSIFPGASAAAVKIAVTRSYARRPRTVAPPQLDAWASLQYLASQQRGTHHDATT